MQCKPSPELRCTSTKHICEARLFSQAFMTIEANVQPTESQRECTYTHGLVFPRLTLSTVMTMLKSPGSLARSPHTFHFPCSLQPNFHNALCKQKSHTSPPHHRHCPCLHSFELAPSLTCSLPAIPLLAIFRLFHLYFSRLLTTLFTLSRLRST